MKLPRFLIAIIFAPLIALNIHAVIAPIVNGNLPDQFPIFPSFFAGSASGVLVFILVGLVIYAVLSILIYYPIYLSNKFWYQYSLYGSIPIIVVGLVQIFSDLRLNYVEYLYASILLSTSFWVLCSLKLTIFFSKGTKNKAIPTVLESCVFLLIFVILYVMVNYSYLGLTIKGQVVDFIKKPSSICMTLEEQKSTYCKNRPLLMGVYNPLIGKKIYSSYSKKLNCVPGDTVVLGDISPMIEKINNNEIYNHKLRRLECLKNKI